MKPASWDFGTIYLVQAVSWTGGSPHLDVVDVATRSPRAVDLVRHRLSFRVEPEGRYCIGRFVFVGDDDVRLQPCPEQSPSAPGDQCEFCAATDEFRFIHQVHRGGHVSPGLRSYVSQPHWLYVATFADASSKVGTAAQIRKRARLDEQGAVRATYVARTADGYSARLHEDAVSKALGLVQAKRRSAKVAALARPRPNAEIDSAHRDAVTSVGQVLADQGLAVPFEDWQPAAENQPFFSDARASSLATYPHPLIGGSHCLTVLGLVGGVALVTVNDDDEQLVVDLAALKGRRVTAADVRSPVTLTQSSLF